MYFGNDPDISAEEHFLRRPKTLWQKFRAKFLRSPVWLGKFYPVGATDWLDFYFFWCPIHEKYQVSCLYGHGHDFYRCIGEFVCQDCIKEKSISQIPMGEGEYKEFLRTIEEEFKNGTLF